MLTPTLQRGRRTTQLMALRMDYAVSPPRPARPPHLRRFVWTAVLLALVVVGAYVRRQATTVASEHRAPSEPPLRQVTVIQPERALSREIVLPATVQAFQATDLFARANGFLKAWHVDIGGSVKAGQLLAEIETPELDQELAQAIAALKQGQAEHKQALAELEEGKAELSLAQASAVKVQANLDFAVGQAKRYETLVTSQTVAREEYENAVRDRDAQSAELASAQADIRRRQTNLETRRAIIDNKSAMVRNREANVQRLRDLTGFQRVVAPFDGIVTRRHAEVGNLVTAGSGAGARPLFSVAQVDVLRVHAAVPQSSALGIKPGDQARITIPEKPGEVFAAKVARTAGAVEPTSRSLLVEMELPNPKGELLPGVYAQVRFQSRDAQADFVIPAQAMFMRSDGPQALVVTPDGTLRTTKLTLGRDFGRNVEVVSGLHGDENLVLNPSDDLRDGQTVQIAAGAEGGNLAARK